MLDLLFCERRRTPTPANSEVRRRHLRGSGILIGFAENLQPMPGHAEIRKKNPGPAQR